MYIWGFTYILLTSISAYKRSPTKLCHTSSCIFISSTNIDLLILFVCRVTHLVITLIKTVYNIPCCQQIKINILSMSDAV